MDGFIRENQIRIDDLGVPLFLESPKMVGKEVGRVVVFLLGPGNFSGAELLNFRCVTRQKLAVSTSNCCIERSIYFQIISHD